MGIWALPFLAIASYFFYDSAGCCQLSWVVLIPIGMGALGAFLLITALLASDKVVMRRRNWIDDGNSIIGALFMVAVGILAIPIWEAWKRLRTHDRQE